MAKLQPLHPTVPLTAFNRGKASKIFAEVKKSGPTVVLKNNEPECVLLSPDDYNALIERVCDAELLHTAEERLKDYDPAKTIPFEEVAARNGIELATPNKTTKKTLDDARIGKDMSRPIGTVDELWNDLNT